MVLEVPAPKQRALLEAMLQASGASVERAVAASTSVFGTSKSETMRQASGGLAESAAAASDYSPPCFLA